MKVKKYPQSHLVITNDIGKKLIIDPGYLTFEKFKVEDFQGADCYLITHQHDDHLGPDTIKEIVGKSPVYGNSDVCVKLKQCGVSGIAIKDKQKFSVEGFTIQAFDLPHFQKLDTIMPPNTGFLIHGVFFHPGDGWKLEGVKAEKAAVPISGPPDGDTGFNQAITLAKSLGATVVIPIHYDKYPADVTEFSKLAQKEGIRVISLNIGEEVDV